MSQKIQFERLQVDSAHLFFDKVRDIFVIYGVIFLLTFVFCLSFLWWFRRKLSSTTLHVKSSDDSADDDESGDDERLRIDIPYGFTAVPHEYSIFNSFLVQSLRFSTQLVHLRFGRPLRFLLCAFVLTVAVMWLVLTVFTILVSTPHLRLHWFLYFVNKEFVRDLWRVVTGASTIALLSAPFAYFYDESAGLPYLTRHWNWRPLASRLVESLIVSILFASILFGIGGFSYALLVPSSVSPISSPSFFSPTLEWLPFEFLSSSASSSFHESFAWASTVFNWEAPLSPIMFGLFHLPGLLLCIFLPPVGFQEVIRRMRALLQIPDQQQNLFADYQAATMDVIAQSRNLSEASLSDDVHAGIGPINQHASAASISIIQPNFRSFSLSSKTSSSRLKLHQLVHRVVVEAAESLNELADQSNDFPPKSQIDHVWNKHVSDTTEFQEIGDDEIEELEPLNELLFEDQPFLHPEFEASQLLSRLNSSPTSSSSSKTIKGLFIDLWRSWVVWLRIWKAAIEFRFQATVTHSKRLLAKIRIIFSIWNPLQYVWKFHSLPPSAFAGFPAVTSFDEHDSQSAQASISTSSKGFKSPTIRPQSSLSCFPSPAFEKDLINVHSAFPFKELLKIAPSRSSYFTIPRSPTSELSLPLPLSQTHHSDLSPQLSSSQSSSSSTSSYPPSNIFEIIRQPNPTSITSNYDDSRGSADDKESQSATSEADALVSESTASPKPLVLPAKLQYQPVQRRLSGRSNRKSKSQQAKQKKLKQHQQQLSSKSPSDSSVAQSSSSWNSGSWSLPAFCLWSSSSASASSSSAAATTQPIQSATPRRSRSLSVSALLNALKNITSASHDDPYPQHPIPVPDPPTPHASPVIRANSAPSSPLLSSSSTFSIASPLSTAFASPLRHLSSLSRRLTTTSTSLFTSRSHSSSQVSTPVLDFSTSSSSSSESPHTSNAEPSIPSAEDLARRFPKLFGSLSNLHTEWARSDFNPPTTSIQQFPSLSSNSFKAQSIHESRLMYLKSAPSHSEPSSILSQLPANLRPFIRSAIKRRRLAAKLSISVEQRQSRYCGCCCWSSHSHIGSACRRVQSIFGVLVRSLLILLLLVIFTALPMHMLVRTGTHEIAASYGWLSHFSSTGSMTSSPSISNWNWTYATRRSNSIADTEAFSAQSPPKLKASKSHPTPTSITRQQTSSSLPSQFTKLPLIPILGRIWWFLKLISTWLTGLAEVVVSSWYYLIGAVYSFASALLTRPQIPSEPSMPRFSRAPSSPFTSHQECSASLAPADHQCFKSESNIKTVADVSITPPVSQYSHQTSDLHLQPFSDSNSKTSSSISSSFFDEEDWRLIEASSTASLTFTVSASSSLRRSQSLPLGSLTTSSAPLQSLQSPPTSSPSSTTSTFISTVSDSSSTRPDRVYGLSARAFNMVSIFSALVLGLPLTMFGNNQSTWASLFLVMDLLLVGYFVFAAVYGLFNRAWFVELHNQAVRQNRFRLRYLLIVVVLLLWLASSLPLAVWMLGLTVFNLAEFYPSITVFFPGSTPHLYAFCYLIVFAWQFLGFARLVMFAYALLDKIAKLLWNIGSRLAALARRIRQFCSAK